MSQKKRSDKNSVTTALGGFKGAIESVPLPQGVELRSEDEMVIWGQVTRARAREDWRDMDVEIISSNFMHRHWTENLDLSDEDAVAATLGALGFNQDELLEAARTPGIGKEYDRNTQFAIEHSVFGSPTYFVDDDMFYGQDNLVLVERALKLPFG